MTLILKTPKRERTSDWWAGRKVETTGQTGPDQSEKAEPDATKSQALIAKVGGESRRIHHFGPHAVSFTASRAPRAQPEGKGLRPKPDWTRMATPEPQADNVLPHRAETVPADKFHMLVATLEEVSEEKAALSKALAREARQCRALQREIDDLLDQAADRDTVRKCLEYWRLKVDKPRARIDLSTGRARHVRWVCRHEDWGPRGFCVAVVGLVHTPWFVKHDKTDVVHLVGFHKGVYDEARFEEFLRRGRIAIGEPPK